MRQEILFLLMLLPLPVAYGIDLCLGDPPWLYHPVRLVGACIAKLEPWLRRINPQTPEGELRAGKVLAIGVPLFFLLISAALLALCRWLHIAVWFAVETVLCYQLLATRSLQQESMLVYKQLRAKDLPAAREAVGRIVGRDTDRLDEQGVARATVETIAENTADGVIAPMLYMALGGAPLALCYKAVNTLDSMVGYQNDRYLNFGRASARLDDAANYLPARAAAQMMIASAEIGGYSVKGARRIYRRDRQNHASPNSAHTEAVCAGALGIQLGGDSYYFGELKHKPTIGDATREIDIRDIPRANRLMFYTSLLSLMTSCFIRAFVLLVALR